MPIIKRRQFIGNAARVSAGLTLLSASSAGKAISANDKVVLGFIGVGGRGSDHVRGFTKRDDTEIAYLCEVNEQRSGIPELMNLVENQKGKPPKRVYDLHKVLEDKSVDAVVISTNDHWHALGTIWACQAGKDVYVEKPPSLTIWEGRKMVEAARKYHRIVQVGTQNRSAPYNLKALDYIRSGKLGKIHLCKVFNLKTGPESFHIGPDGEPPEGFHYDLWLGPVPYRPYNKSIIGNRLMWAFSAGDIGDDGVHQLDLARMLIGKEYPQAVHSSGGRYEFPDDREVPDTLVTTYDFADMVMTFELSQWSPYMDKIAGDIRNGDLFPYWPQCATRIEIYGTKGVMYVARHGGGWQVFTNAKTQSRPGELVTQEFGRVPDDPHKENFIDCIRTRKLPNADIEEGHRSACLVHLAGISYRVGCRKLLFDSQRECFINDEAANRLLKSPSREPYQIPENV